MKYFCETILSDKIHFFLSDIQPKNDKIKSYELNIDEIKLKDLDMNISIFNSMLTPHNALYIYMMLSEICADGNIRKYFNKKASEFAYRHLQVTSSF